MPGNPKECRAHAARCAELAVKARTAQLRATFLDLSKNWENFAIQLENAFAQLAESEDNRLKVRESVEEARRLREKNSPISYFEGYTTFAKSGHRAPHWSFKLRACLRGQSAVISSDQSNSFASMP
jgi:hypothetical protein